MEPFESNAKDDQHGHYEHGRWNEKIYPNLGKTYLSGYLFACYTQLQNL